MQNLYYVYVLRSINNLDKYYVGYTNNLDRRIKEHNSESQIYSQRYAPWEIDTYIVFRNEAKAKDFEKYLKSHSGKAFLNKRLI